MAKTRVLAGCVLPLGMDLDDAPSTAGSLRGAPRKAQEKAVRPFLVDQAEAGKPRLSVAATDERHDHWVERDGESFAGQHLIIDLWGAERLDDLAHVERALVDAVDAAGATLLHIHLHHFTPNGGISGVAVLAESHISIHSWPEKNYAALDVFMCGDADPNLTIPVLERAFRPAVVNVGVFLRGTEAGTAG